MLPIEGMTILIYDITDDWTKASLTDRELQRNITNDEWFLKQSDQVIVCSPQLYRDKVAGCKNLTLIPNGVEFNRYHPQSLALTKRPADIAHLHRPLAGYIGTLHEDRLDIDLLISVAQKLPDTQFLFIGPSALSPASTDVLSKLPNIQLLGSRPYQELPAYLACIDIYMFHTK